MDQHVTRLRPEVQSPQGREIAWTPPPDLLEQIRGRLGVLALLMTAAFAVDPAIFLVRWIALALGPAPVGDELLREAPFYGADLCVVAVSLLLWWTSRNPRVPTARLRAIGLVYEVALCFVIALRTFWSYYQDTGLLPNLTWVPAVIVLFPLVLPAPPGLMLAAAVASGAMPLLALVLLRAWGEVTADPSALWNIAVSSAVAVGFAYMGARVIHGLSRAVSAARELGSYRLEEKLGQGGMGEVWRARHHLLARPAAIKLIRRSGAGDGRQPVPSEVMRRFEREAQVIARLRSPHTVELFDFGVSDDGAFYYAMELLDGLDADRLVRQYGPVPAERAIQVLRQVCHSLSEAESCGLVHRDIKPANVFLCRYGEELDFVKVLDFGIVKAAGEAAGSEAGETREDAVPGTPAFMAPEQALGEGKVDGRADIYATGCVAHWLLTGQYVFTADTAMGVLLQHAHAAPPAPSTRSGLPIPAALDRLVLACLAKDPAARPQTARELARRLGEIELAEPWTEERARAWWAQHHLAQ